MRVLVRKPAGRPLNSRSAPSMPPKIAASVSLKNVFQSNANANSIVHSISSVIAV